MTAAATRPVAAQTARGYPVVCPGCGERREVSKTTASLIRRGLRSGRCRDCAPAGRPRSRPRTCLRCGLRLRWPGTRKADAPGTVPHARDGYCHECLAGHRRDMSDAIAAAAATTRLGCTDDPDWYAHAARRLDVNSEARRAEAFAELADEADLRCWRCPVAAECAQLASGDRAATGAYGGRLWYQGAHLTAGGSAQ